MATRAVDGRDGRVYGGDERRPATHEEGRPHSRARKSPERLRGAQRHVPRNELARRARQRGDITVRVAALPSELPDVLRVPVTHHHGPDAVEDPTLRKVVQVVALAGRMADIFVGDNVPGGQEVTYSIPAHEAGEYYFQCDLHPGMNGTVTVK